MSRSLSFASTSSFLCRPAATAAATLGLALACLAGSSAALAQSRQSPIDINPLQTVGTPLPTITSRYLKSDVTLVNTFNPAAVPALSAEFATLRVNVPAGSSVTVNSTVYDLVQFHFHTPAEHTILGVHAPMEIHFVHLKRGACLGATDSLLVIGAPIQAGLANAELQKIFGLNLPKDSTAPAQTIAGFNLANVLPLDQRSFRYAGSLTAPSAVGCNNPAGDVTQQLATDVFPENVSWVVRQSPVYMSLTQIRKFQALFSFMGNSRPAKPLLGRTVFRDPVLGIL